MYTTALIAVPRLQRYQRYEDPGFDGANQNKGHRRYVLPAQAPSNTSRKLHTCRRVRH
jgi:hypothetical protein